MTKPVALHMVVSHFQNEFGAERLLKVVKANSGGSARQVVDAIFAAVQEFRGDTPPNDDMTAVALKITATA